MLADVSVSQTSAKMITSFLIHITKKSMKHRMKKLLVLVSAALLLAGLSTSCNKVGCHCYLKTDIMHIAPEYEDETSTKDECKAKEAELNEEWGSNVVKFTQ